MKLIPRFLGLFALGAAALVSCQREAALEEILREESLTRTTYSSTGSIDWNSNDQLRVRQVCYTGTSSTPHAQLRASAAPVPHEGKYYVKASFDVVDAAVYKGKESEGYKFMYQAFYPASRASKNGAKVSLVLPDSQQPRSNSFDPGADLVISDQVYSKSQRTGGLKVYGLSFSRLSSIGVLTVKGLDSSAVIENIEILADKPLAGTYSIDIDNTKTIQDGKNKITLDMTQNQPSNSNNFKVYFTCLPGTFTNVVVKVTTSNVGTYTRTFSQLVFNEGQETKATVKFKKKTLMTYNVGIFNKSGQYRYEDIAKLLVAENATYVSLNEVDSVTTRTGHVYQLEELVTRMNTISGQQDGYWYHFGPALKNYQGGAYGSGVISAEQVVTNSAGNLKYYNFQLTNKVNGKIVRRMLSDSTWRNEEIRSVAVLETSDCVFASAHLALTNTLRKEQVKKINNWFNSRYANTKKPVIICGDFNALPKQADSLMAGWRALSDTSQCSFNTHGSKPAKCIDYIYCRNNSNAPTVNVISASVILKSKKYPNIKDYSDHYPVKVVVAW